VAVDGRHRHYRAHDRFRVQWSHKYTPCTDVCEPEMGVGEGCICHGGVCRERDKVERKEKQEQTTTPQPPPAGAGAGGGGGVGASGGGKDTVNLIPILMHIPKGYRIDVAATKAANETNGKEKAK